MSDDLGTGTVDGIDTLTGYPKDKYGNLLRTSSIRDGSLIENWDKPGTELPNFTNPYGFLEYAIGNGDDFVCFDYAEIDTGPRGTFIILHATRNCETSSFIEKADYAVLPCNTKEECLTALRYAAWMCDELPFDDIRHSRSGWNQDGFYFVRAVAHTLFKWRFEKYNKAHKSFEDWTTNRMLRYGGKRIDKVIDELLAGKE
jgi:hypothetical protein